MVTDHSDACQAAGRAVYVWCRADGEKKRPIAVQQSELTPSQTWVDARSERRKHRGH